MAGRPQKPANQLQNPRGGRLERRSFPVEVPREPLKAPRCPNGLGKAGAAIWQAYWTDPVSLTASGVDGYAIAEYCRLHDRIEAIEAELDGEQDEEGNTRYVVGGANGPILNPLLRALKLFVDRRDRLSEKLGVTALNRQRLGLVATQREIGVADLRQRLERGKRATEAIEAECVEADVNLDAM